MSLEVEGDDNILPLVTAEVRNNVLRLSNNGSYSTTEPVKFKISVPNLEVLNVSGAGKIDIKGMNNEKFADRRRRRAYNQCFRKHQDGGHPHKRRRENQHQQP